METKVLPMTARALVHTFSDLLCKRNIIFNNLPGKQTSFVKKLEQKSNVNKSAGKILGF